MAPAASSRRQVRRLLEQPDFAAALDEIKKLPPERALKHLQAALAAGKAETKWRAVTALGAVIAGLPTENLEAAREFLRRLLWCLNEECGASPWGVAEALGEILANSRTLAQEYANLLISYIQPEGHNFLDWEPLLAGAVWGVGRLASAHPGLAGERGAGESLMSLLGSDSAAVRGTAAWALGNLGQGHGAAEALAELAEDPAEVELWREGVLWETTVGSLAREAEDKIINNNG
ncbi:MAG: HEAT repeat domain-containing protein [Desulfarculaceae bacterium]|nr:HEAT repeat domain-containing protein [Desulfarculaceae bacterium]